MSTILKSFDAPDGRSRFKLDICVVRGNDSSVSSPDETINIETLVQELDQIREEFSDLRILYENTIDHSTRIENELEEKNRKINELLTAMKMYLSPQLYNSIVKGSFDAKLRYQRKKLTMFFSDIVDFTAATDIIEPETLSRLLNDYLSEMSRIAEEYGGTIDKYIGDAIVIFFGDPEYVDDITHARQCVAMALAMLHSIRKMNSNWSDAGAPTGLAVRIGINTGYCTVGNFGSESRMDYTIIGGQVNIASRIEHIAQPNTVFISDSSYALVRDFVTVDSSTHIQVKGIHYPVGVHRVIGLKHSKLASDSIITIDNGSFHLDPIEFDRKGANQEERRRIREALLEAMRLLNE